MSKIEGCCVVKSTNLLEIVRNQSISIENSNFLPERDNIPVHSFRGLILIKDPQKELNQLGLSPKLIGYWDLLTAIELVLKNKSALTAMIKEIYIPTAAKRCVEWDCPEASIRKAIRLIWQRGNRDLLERIMNHSLPEPPPAGEFLGAFAFYLEDASEESN